MRLYQLQRTVLSIKNNPAKFLNGITSNTLDKPKNAFLDIHGKIIATFDQAKIDDGEHLIVIEEKFYEVLMAHLEKYIKLSKAVVEKMDHRVYFDLDGEYKRDADEVTIAQKKGQLVFTQKNLKSNVSDDEFTLFRLKNNIPVQGVDYNHELLLNVDEEEFVSFTKGCFLGQEFISKVHSRSKPSWKLVVKFEDECSADEKQKMTSKMRDPKTGKTIGFVFISNR